MSDDLERIRRWRDDNAEEFQHSASLHGEQWALRWHDVDACLSDIDRLSHILFLQAQHTEREMDRRDVILRRFAQRRPGTYRLGNVVGCCWCDTEFPTIDDTDRPEFHAEGCPWRQARELLGEQTDE